jgi:cohesin loading factor subunit SCC2
VFLTDYRRDYERDPTLPGLVKLRPFFRRALFTVGLLLRHFDFTDKDVIQGLEVRVYFMCEACPESKDTSRIG